MGNIIFNNVKLKRTKQDAGLEINNLALPTDKIVALVGAKACGKTNFLDVLAGKKHPKEGTITYENGSLNKGDVIYVGSKTYLKGFSTVRENIEYFAKEYPNFSKDIAYKYLAKMEIPVDKYKYRNFDNMVQSAINCILAIAARAKITILDQPCRNKDMKLREMIYDFAQEDNEEFKRLIIISSNIAVDIDKVAEFVVYLREGKLTFALPYEDVDRYTIGLLGKEEVIKSNIGNAEVFYSNKTDDGLLHIVVRNIFNLDTMNTLQLNGVITQYVNLINLHTYIVKEDFAFEEKIKLREEEERRKQELKDKKAAKKKNNKRKTLIAKDDSQEATGNRKKKDKEPKDEKKETFGEKLKRILTTPL